MYNFVIDDGMEVLHKGEHNYYRKLSGRPHIDPVTVRRATYIRMALWTIKCQGFNHSAIYTMS
jgi:hypothetical protein